jgi:hypothetical protein
MMRRTSSCPREGRLTVTRGMQIAQTPSLRPKPSSRLIGRWQKTHPRPELRRRRPVGRTSSMRVWGRAGNIASSFAAIAEALRETFGVKHVKRSKGSIRRPSPLRLAGHSYGRCDPAFSM